MMVSTGTEEGGYAFLNSRMHGRGSDILEKFRKPLVSFEVARHEGRGERERDALYSRIERKWEKTRENV